MEVAPRITVEPGKCAGKPCIRGFRFTVEQLLGLLADGMKPEDILHEWDFLEAADIDAAKRYLAN